MGRGLRVIAGEAGGLRLVAPKGSRTRPTADRVKESLFAALGEAVVGARVLDVYAGSGALAIEALSRGASAALLVDRDPAAAAAIRRNLATTRLTARGRVVRRSVEGLLRDPPPAEAPFDLALVDPPYGESPERIGRVVGQLTSPRWAAPAARLVLERAVGSPLPRWPDGWVVAWERASGDTLVVVVTRLAP